MRSFFLRKLSTVLLVYLAVFLLCASSVFATAAKPPQTSTDKAVISIAPKGEGTSQITENITLQNVNVVKDKKLEHVFVTFAGVAMKDLLVTQDQKPLTFNEVQGDGLKRIFVNVPEGANALTYTIQYTVQLGNGDNRIPLVVPLYGTNGIKNSAVELNFNLPKGMYLHTTMPNYLGADNAPVKETITGIPSFAIFDYGPAPQAIKSSTWVGILCAVAILIVLVGWLLYERRRSGTVNV